MKSYRRTFFVAGAEHPNFVKAMAEFYSEGQTDGLCPARQRRCVQPLHDPREYL